MQHPMRSLLAGSFALLLVTLAPAARAEQQWVLSPGPFFFGHDYARLSGEQPSSPRLGGVFSEPAAGGEETQVRPRTQRA